MLWHLQLRRDALLLQLQGGVVQGALYDLHHVQLSEVISRRPAVVHLVELRQCAHVLQQLVHALALGIAALQEVGLLLFRHVRMVEDALQVAVDARGRRLQLVGGVLRELPLDAHLVLLRVAQLPVEHDDGMADVAQLVVGQALLQLVLQLLGLHSRSQLACL